MYYGKQKESGINPIIVFFNFAKIESSPLYHSPSAKGQVKAKVTLTLRSESFSYFVALGLAQCPAHNSTKGFAYLIECYIILKLLTKN